MIRKARGGVECHRIFLGIRPPAAVAGTIGGWRDALRPRRPVSDDQLHLTTAIFDDSADYPEAMVDRARAVLGATELRPFRIVLERIVADSAGIRLIPSERLRGVDAVQARLAAALRDAGLAMRQRWRFSPHVTLGYGDGAPLDAWVDAISWQGEDLVLVHSLVGQGRHVTLGQWAL